MFCKPFCLVFFLENEWAKCQNFPCIVQSSSRILESTSFKKRIFFSLFSRDSLALKKYSSCKTEIFQITNKAVLVGVTKPLKNAALFSRYLAIISFTPYNAVFMFLEASPA